MALLKAVDTETVVVKSKLPKTLEREIYAYMEWVGLKNIDTFLEQAAQYILQHDKAWRKHNQK